MEVAPNANPPVCRIMDFGKFKFDEAQRAKESRRKATTGSIKEMKYRPKIGVGDFDTKTRQVSRFLGEGHKVKITIMFRGREMSHPELGKKILDHVAELVGPIAKVEAAPKLDGRNMIMVLAPDRRAAQQASRDAAKAAAHPEAARPDALHQDTGRQGATPKPAPAAGGPVAPDLPAEATSSTPEAPSVPTASPSPTPPPAVATANGRRPAPTPEAVKAAGTAEEIA